MFNLAAEQQIPTPDGAGLFELIRPIGTGGQAQVWLARDLLTGQIVCIRFMRPPDEGLPADRVILEWENRQERFLRGHEVHCKLGGALVPSALRASVGSATHSYNTDTGERIDLTVLYMVIEYLPGGDVHAALQGMRPETRRRIGFHVVEAVLRCIEFAHEHNEFHRDPGLWNFLLYWDEAGWAAFKLTDWESGRSAGNDRSTELGGGRPQLDLPPGFNPKQATDADWIRYDLHVAAAALRYSLALGVSTRGEPPEREEHVAFRSLQPQLLGRALFGFLNRLQAGVYTSAAEALAALPEAREQAMAEPNPPIPWVLESADRGIEPTVPFELPQGAAGKAPVTLIPQGHRPAPHDAPPGPRGRGGPLLPAMDDLADPQAPAPIVPPSDPAPVAPQRPTRVVVEPLRPPANLSFLFAAASVLIGALVALGAVLLVAWALWGPVSTPALAFSEVEPEQQAPLPSQDPPETAPSPLPSTGPQEATTPTAAQRLSITTVHSSSAAEGCRVGSQAAGPCAPGLATDGDPETAWCEGIAGAGAGEWIELSLPGDPLVQSLTLVNGYAKGGASSRIWEANGRVRTLVVSAGGERRTLALQDTGLGQQVSLNPPVRASALRLAIGAASSGTRYEDTCISEIQLWGARS